MKTLIVFGVGVALGLFLKKAEKVKEPKFILIDDRKSLGGYLFGDDAKEAFKKHLKIAISNL
ncbi:hypothetical protein [Acinetobacter radioresistens]|uniref:hypothetical protein n=1 Tax=Acinetobacter radioresistens TaxID=40216 RepID=UPI00125EA583|nr:hypothetical protein [Acinetobacter radioresistens]